MRKEIADLWIKELNSQKWKKGKYFLEHSETYCVFGILCNLAALEGICDHSGFRIGKFDSEMFLVPDSVIKWSGLRSSDGELPSGKSLTYLNDSGTNFRELAKIINQNWEYL